ncbi:hypothetical protein Y032_0154g2951 [Ancylostoma ceylanicum]|uniref:Uncharacterized protein n=1 Tax=Ancylostoma ceylanicum TaxID=53326 RepID=A0A016SZQ3_9BILA|nr:hypothetical protein Y032_0154g2951 [Ancylostoma ceylanicum]
MLLLRAVSTAWSESRPDPRRGTLTLPTESRAFITSVTFAVHHWDQHGEEVKNLQISPTCKMRWIPAFNLTCDIPLLRATVPFLTCCIRQRTCCVRHSSVLPFLSSRVAFVKGRAAFVKGCAAFVKGCAAFVKGRECVRP